VFIQLTVAVCEDNGAVLTESTKIFVEKEAPAIEIPIEPGAKSVTRVDCENWLISAYKNNKRGLTANAARRLVHPERYAGGLRSFHEAFKNLVVRAVLIEAGETQRSTIYKLNPKFSRSL
jgi:hypothetical protein